MLQLAHQGPTPRAEHRRRAPPSSTSLRDGGPLARPVGYQAMPSTSLSAATILISVAPPLLLFSAAAPRFVPEDIPAYTASQITSQTLRSPL